MRKIEADDAQAPPDQMLQGATRWGGGQPSWVRRPAHHWSLTAQSLVHWPFSTSSGGTLMSVELVMAGDREPLTMERW
jgi:hypothetical protein